MNSTPTPSASDTVRNRRLLILGIVLILTAIAITAGRLIHSRMQQARLMQDRPADLQYGVKVYSLQTAEGVQSARAKINALGGRRVTALTAPVPTFCGEENETSRIHPR